MNEGAVRQRKTYCQRLSNRRLRMARLDEPESPTTEEEARRQTSGTIHNHRESRSFSLQAQTPTSLENPPTIQREALKPIHSASISQSGTTTSSTSRPHQRQRRIRNRRNPQLSTVNRTRKERIEVKKSHQLLCQMEGMDQRTQFLGPGLGDGQRSRGNRGV